ncbi:poly-gamma-glutamate hydrolase family protein [Parasphingorhabdus sp. JC815]|uniref:poly-gamma-glutamate hydrolase family protein n=1 Tax=Parasphingorhabdus sp. JC815 TaxID=3232140 RepID=UPI00345B39FA
MYDFNHSSHGGWIEPGTSEIAESIAGTEYSFYDFEALRHGAHEDYHRTSHKFDEPKALDNLQFRASLW